MRSKEKYCVICDPTNECPANDLNCGLSNCEHEFHYECIQNWVTKRVSTCPVCRADVKSLRRTVVVGGEPQIFLVKVKKKLFEEDESDILYVVQFLSDSEDGLDDVICHICLENDRGHELMLCSSRGCESAAHFDCLDPPLDRVPDDDWFCPACKSKDTERDARVTTLSPNMHASPNEESELQILEEKRTVDEPRTTTASSLNDLEHHFQEVFAQPEDTQRKPSAGRLLLDTPEKGTPQKYEVIDDTPPPTRQPIFDAAPQKKVSGSDSSASVVTAWKTVAPSITQAPRIQISKSTSSITQDRSLRSDQFQNIIDNYRYQHTTPSIGGNVNRNIGYTPARQINGSEISLPPTIQSVRAPAPHRSFPIHRSTADTKAYESPKRKRQPLSEEALTEPSIAHEVRESLKTLIRNHSIAPQDAVVLFNEVMKSLKNQRAIVTQSKIHQTVTKCLAQSRSKG